MEKDVGITVKKSEDFSEWYTQVVLKGLMADYSEVKGCMIIRENGYAVWEAIQRYFDERIKSLGVKNMYFPLFVPEKFFKREAEHAQGFSPEVAWISNRDEDGDRLAIRPTSETVMYDAYSKWIRSHRDLPFRRNQWCNVVRWETSAVKLFLRTREFLWQEGHCVYETKEQADEETILILKEYQKLCEDLLCVPVIPGYKTENEKFAGALYTTTIEALMPDGRALQMGTSHNLGQFFAKGFDIKFLGKDEKKHIPWQTSWGVSTRMIGGMIMTHGDDQGLVMPPLVAPTQVVIVPILFEKTKDKVLAEAEKIEESLKGFRVELDTRDEYTPGWKFNQWELMGVPLRIEIGPRDIENKAVMVVRRDNGHKEQVKIVELKRYIKDNLEDMQKSLLKKAKKILKENIVTTEEFSELIKAIKEKKLVLAPFCLGSTCEDWIKDKTGGASTRCIPLEGAEVKKGQKCVHCDHEAKNMVYFGKSY